MRRVFMISAVFGLLLLSACGKNEPLPVGTQTRTGVLTPIAISLDRRGTHLFSSGSIKIAYAESSKVNLHEIEGKTIELTGHFEKNILEKDLPVFVIESARALSEESRSWSFPSLSLTMHAPTSWNGSLNSEGNVIFLDAGNAVPVLSISRAPYNASPFSATGSHASSVSSVHLGFLGTFRAARETLSASHFRLTVDLGSFPSVEPETRTMVFDFLFDPSSTLDDQAKMIKIVEDGIRIGATMPSSSSNQNSSLSAYSVPGMPGEIGAPCGGSAGVLCPAGQYCLITDKKLNIGRCKSR